jgi:carboxypeptidase Taq
MTASDTYSSLITTAKEINLLGSAATVLHWDQETYMPTKGAEHRANQTSLIARLTHEQFTQPRIGELLAEVERTGPAGDVAVNVRELRRSYDRATKIPASLVEEITKTAVLGHHAWIDARKKSDYGLFKPWLSRMLDLKMQEAK